LTSVKNQKRCDIRHIKKVTCKDHFMNNARIVYW